MHLHFLFQGQHTAKQVIKQLLRIRPLFVYLIQNEDIPCISVMYYFRECLLSPEPHCSPGKPSSNEIENLHKI